MLRKNNEFQCIMKKKKDLDQGLIKENDVKIKYKKNILFYFVCF